jgi:hypothetical protein
LRDLQAARGGRGAEAAVAGRRRVDGCLRPHLRTPPLDPASVARGDGARERRIDKVWLITDAAAASGDASGRGSGRWRDGAALATGGSRRLARACSGAAPGDHMYLVDPRGHWMMRVR